MPVPETLNVVPVPLAVLTVTVSLFAPEEAGLKVIVPVVQEEPEAIVDDAVQVPSPTVKSVESLFVNGVEDRSTRPPEAVSVIEPVQVDDEPELTVGQLTEPEAARLP